MILAGDIGGTKTRLGLFRAGGETLQLAHSRDYSSRQYDGLEEIVLEFASETGQQIESACFGVAGPVVKGECTTPTLGWNIRAGALAEKLSLPSVTLINDLEATAYGIAELSPADFMTLNEGESAEGNVAVLAAGTGLGAACLFWNGIEHVPSASEAGHMDFAPRNELESELLSYMLQKHEHVSFERLVSGPGIVEIYNFFLASQQERPAERGTDSVPLSGADAAAAISQAARLGACPIAVRTINFFNTLYGAVAGNLALAILATGGIYIGGGIAPKNISSIRDGAFLKAFREKGRFSDLMDRIPVRVILNDQTPLLGAARMATRRSLK